MVFTEDEAREHWCPLTCGTEDDRCIASECMWWQWKEVDEVVGASFPWISREKIRKGYCGCCGFTNKKKEIANRKE